MFWLFLACTIGSSGPASTHSRSAEEAEKMGTVAKNAGALSNAARELEAASAAARQRIANGANPAMEADKLEEIMQRIEEIEAQIQAENKALVKRIGQPQSTEETRE